MKRMIICILLVLAMLINVLPGIALADVKDLAGNTDAENNAILTQLSELTGGNSDEAYALLENLGLLDDEGNLNLSQSIMLDDESMTLDEILTLLDDPDVDLSRVVDVDGVPIALGDLKTMVLIEQELARIKETYFSGGTFTPEQLDLLEDLMRQIENEGISTGPNEGISTVSMEAQDTGLTINITPDPGNRTEFQYSPYSPEKPGTVTLKYIVTLSGTLPAVGTAAFSWKCISGVMGDEYVKTEFSLQIEQGEMVQPQGRIEFGPGATDSRFVVDDVSQFRGTLTITIGCSYGKPTLKDILGLSIDGTLHGFIEFYNGEGLVFSEDGITKDLVSIPITVTKPNAFEGGTWVTYAEGLSNSNRSVTDGGAGSNEHKNPCWDITSRPGTYVDPKFALLRSTANEIYADGDSYYKVNAFLTLYGSNLPYKGYMYRALPVAYDYGDSTSSAQQMTILRYYWAYTRYASEYDLREIDLDSSPIKTKDTEPRRIIDPYILTYNNDNFDNDNNPIQYVSMVVSTNSKKYPATLRATWPQDPIFTTVHGGTSSSFSLDDTVMQRTVSSEIFIYDETPPEVTGVTIPAGIYTIGQYIPILITFSEPVITPGLSLKINGSTVGADTLLMDTTGRKAAAMYKVKDVDDSTINISSIRNLKDLAGNTASVQNNGGAGWNFKDTVTIKSTFLKGAVTGVSVNPDTIQPDLLEQGTTVTLNLSQETAYRTKYAAYSQSTGYAPFSVKVTNQTTGEDFTVAKTKLEESGGNVCAKAEITGFKPAAYDVAYKVEVIAYEDVSGETGTLIAGKSAAFTVKKVNFVDGVTITYPADDKTELSLAGDYRPKLNISFAGSPTYITGTWQSSDPGIAGIDAAGQVTLTGQAVGGVRFTFTADDGGLTDPDSGSHTKTCTSKEYTVIAGDVPALVVPSEAGRIPARQGEPVEVRWSSNSGFFSMDDFEFTIELFQGNFGEAELIGKTPIYTVKAAKTANSVIIPGDKLTLLSSKDTPAYTVRISMPHPKISSEKLSAMCYIIVSPQAVSVHLARPDSGLYLLDSETTAINWTIDNYTAGHTEGSLCIERISTQDGEDVKSTVEEQAVTSQAGSYTLAPTTVSGLKDTYMVTLRAKNPSDAGYSSDSFPLYVYNANALKLEVDGHKINSLTMDNEDRVKDSLPIVTEDILALREKLALIEYISINHKDYGWSQLKDGMRWSTSAPDKVTVNYRQGGLYEDLTRFSMDTFLPETKMALSGIKDGSATITATHANTGMSAQVAVDVNTLRNKLYLFQVTPMQKTELGYTDGKGKTKTVYTNSEGVLALYEPSSIASDIHLKSTGGDGSVWLGTLYNGRLLSGERDATRLQLYPLNTFKLRQAARADIFLKKPDGSPYFGSLTLRGGVYKNGGYCQAGGLLANAVPSPAQPLKDGTKDQTVSIGADGKLVVYMDSTQFWSSEKGEDNTAGMHLQPTDNLQYILELTDMPGYYPLLVFANGNIMLNDLMRSAQNVTVLESCSNPDKPFVSNQIIDYGLTGDRQIDVRHNPGRFGPSEKYPEAKLLTTILLWGQDVQKDYRFIICDEYGYIPAAQESRIIPYPFSSVPVVQNVLTLSSDTVTESGWISPGRDAGLRARLLQGNTMLTEQPLPQRVSDFTRLPKLTDSKNITGMMVDLKAKSALGAGTEMSDGNKIVNGLMSLMGKLNGPIDGSSFKMLITPGGDSCEFNAFIWAGYNSLGLDDVDYDEDGLAFDYKLAESSISKAPSLSDMADMAKGSHNPNKAFKEGMAKQEKGGGEGESSVDFSGQLEGYFEAKIKYNFEKAKWEIYVLGGGFTAGFGIAYTYTINEMAGPIPVTAKFEVGGALQLDFKAALRYSEQGDLKWADTITDDHVNDYLTSLRINAYLGAFGGLGFDYSIIALKIGLFGKITLDNQNRFLSRTYLADTSLRQINGQALQLTGEVGIKFVAQFLFITYEFILASGSLSYTWTFNDWKTIDDYWKNTGSGLRAPMFLAGRPGSGLVPISSAATLQSRDYLERYARSWGTAERGASLRPASGLRSGPSGSPGDTLTLLQSNAYPYSLPRLTDDGQFMLYASDNNSADVRDTRVFATKLSGDSYPQGTEMLSPAGFSGFGDSGLSLAGNKDFAAAAWVRQGTQLPHKSAGDALSGAEQTILMNGTEIVASIYTSSGWVPTRITSDLSPDLAPVVATSNSRAIVAWRSVYAADSENLIDFAQQDHILYSIYDNGSWSTPKQLYNGTSGMVRGIDAAMLSDGTAAVAYTLDTDSTDDSPLDFEIGYSIINASGEPISSAIITHDKWLDENPQIAAVRFAKDDERFVLGWHSLRNGLSDIRFAAFDGNGTVSNSFIDSIAQAVIGNEVNVGGNFRFAKMQAGRNDISNLSILWPENKQNDESETDHGLLRVVKFIKDGNDIRLSAAMNVAELPPRTLIDHFDAYIDSDDGKTVKAIIQGTEYKDINPDDPDSYTVYEHPNGSDVLIANDETKLFVAAAAFRNKIQLRNLVVDYANLDVNTLIPIQFNISNAGMDPVNSMTIDIAGSVTAFDGLDIYPNECSTLTCWHPIGNSIENLDYTITADFGDTRDEDIGTVYLDYPDIGVSQFDVVSEDRGIRTLQLTLYNGFAATLGGGKNRSLRLGFYDDALLENIQDVTSSTPGVNVNSDKTLTIDSMDALELTDKGAFTLEVSFDIGRHIKDTGFDEIPDTGLRLYVKAWAEETHNVSGQNENVVLPEYYISNNIASVLLESALVREGKPVSINIEQGLAIDDKTAANIRLHNNSLSKKTTGNLIVSLLDDKGDVLQQQQTYDGDSGSLITLEGEETVNHAFAFNSAGSRIIASYGDLILADDNAKLAALSFEGLAVQLAGFSPDDNDDYVCTAPDTMLDLTQVSFVTESPGATVTVNGVPAVGIVSVPLPIGNSEIVLEVTAEDGSVKQKYILRVNNIKSHTYYNVTFKGHNGAIINVQTVERGSKAAAPADPVRSGYTFAGWYTDAGLTTVYGFDTAVTDNITLYAKWTYNGGGGSSDVPPRPVVYKAIVNIGGNETVLPLTIDEINKTVSAELGAKDTILGEVLITMPAIPGILAYSISIPVSSLSTDVATGTLTLAAGIGNTTIPSNLLNGVTGLNADKAVLSISRGDKGSLPGDLKTDIGDRPLVHFAVSVGGKMVDWSSLKAPVLMSIPYAPAAKELKNTENIVVWYIDDNGNAFIIPNGYYDAVKRMVIFDTTLCGSNGCYAIAYNRMDFSDVPAGAWYHKAVGFIAARGITSGTGENRFSPDVRLTRGEFIVLMMRTYGIAPDENPADNFSDAGETWYTGYLAAARRLRLAAGVGGNMFAPDREITRQEMFTLLYNILGTIGQLPYGDNGRELSNFTDADMIDIWAAEAIAFLIKTGTINGAGDMLDPLGCATRAEMAQMIYNLLSK